MNVESLGLLMAISIIAASVDDATAVPQLLTQVTPKAFQRLTKVWADSKYPNHKLHAWMASERPLWDIGIVSRRPDTKGFV